VPTTSFWQLTPRQSIEAECARTGKPSVVDRCVALLDGRGPDLGFVAVLAGPGADFIADQAPGDETNLYWLRVWATRGLLWAWDDRALPSLRAALTDPAWRVREMAAKVVARHRLGDLLAPVAELRADPTSRVRVAADRAVRQLTEAGA
jgi:HEAT repeat